MLTAVMIIFINHCFINNYLFCYSVVVHFDQYFEIQIVPPEQHASMYYICVIVYLYSDNSVTF
jgi:hypothetical protein